MRAHLKVSLAIHGGTPRPIELGGSALVGSGRAADVRVADPALAPVHLRFLRDGEGVVAIALAPGAFLDGVELVVDELRACAGRPVDIGPARMVAVPWDGEAGTGRDRTESLARELVRDLLGGESSEHPELAPELTVEEGPVAGQRLALPPPEARVVIGRGDTSTWVLLDPDLSRNHAVIERRFDGVWVTDLDSKNGTQVDGRPAPREAPGLLLADGARITLGATVVRYRDPAAAMLVELEGRLSAGGAQLLETVTRAGKRAGAGATGRMPVAAEEREEEARASRWPALAAAAVAVAAIGLLIALFATS